MSLRLSDHKVLHNIVSSSIFSISFGFSHLLTRTSSKTILLFHSHLLDMRLVMVNSYPTCAHGIIIVNYFNN